MKERLTKKDVVDIIRNKQVIARNIGKTITTKLLKEMLEYKRIEEEIGIDLITLYDKFKSANATLNKNAVIPHTIFFTLFGRKWSLTREELE